MLAQTGSFIPALLNCLPYTKRFSRACPTALRQTSPAKCFGRAQAPLYYYLTCSPVVGASRAVVKISRDSIRLQRSVPANACIVRKLPQCTEEKEFLQLDFGPRKSTHNAPQYS